MEKIIRFFIENPKAVQLVQKNELSLVGVSSTEQQAALEAFNGPVEPLKYVTKWR
ncbi:hypothetical protein GCM10007425_00800 [Lysinibacillus alkalisoli]|uniref:ComX pheromone n=1 Tax=Lysinibacillus alkalisoli TaxID=1911548 RepID=A0A917D4H2_9BACI|nr:competence pheromone ComX [Lysinibacillus alkalisoli]GGG10298.1 hypothetical protein GCM10007425_00800 [Lysinibacillus alkalisoli]